MGKKYEEITSGLLWAGGLNMGVLGLFDHNILLQVFRPWPSLLKFIYIAIGISAVYKIATHKS